MVECLDGFEHAEEQSNDILSALVLKHLPILAFSNRPTYRRSVYLYGDTCTLLPPCPSRRFDIV